MKLLRITTSIATIIALLVMVSGLSSWPQPVKAEDTLIQSFTGNGTWDNSGGTYSNIRVKVWGGGGGGGGRNSTSACGAGGGAYSESVFVATSTTYTITVGAGGAGGVPGVSNGQNGGDSSFRNTTTILAKGGSGQGNGFCGEGDRPAGGAAASGVGDTKTSGGSAGITNGTDGGS